MFVKYFENLTSASGFIYTEVVGPPGLHNKINSYF